MLLGRTAPIPLDYIIAGNNRQLNARVAKCKQCTLGCFSETDKLSSQLGKYSSFFNQLGIGLFNWVSLF